MRHTQKIDKTGGREKKDTKKGNKRSYTDRWVIEEGKGDVEWESEGTGKKKQVYLCVRGEEWERWDMKRKWAGGTERER